MHPSNSPRPNPRHRPVKRWLLLCIVLAAIAGIALIVTGLIGSDVNALVYGVAMLTAAALLGLSLMNRLFPKK